MINNRLMLPRSLLCIFFTCAFNVLNAQTIYHLTYNYTYDDGKTDMNAFMVRYDDGTGFIRVAFTDESTNKKYLVDMDMQESYDVKEQTGVTDSSILYFEGMNAKIIMGDTGETYYPDIFIFYRKPGDEYYEPNDVFYFDEQDSVFEGEFTDVKLLEAEDLTEDFVSQFFFKDEAFYKDLFETSVRTLTATEKAATLHLVIVANTNDPDIGSTCALDKDRTVKTFSDLSEFMGIKMEKTVIFGDAYNKQAVQDAVTRLKPSPKDIVIFYYSGHGYSKGDHRQYPYIELRSKSFQALDENSLNIEDIYNTIKEKGAKVSIVISDCCNSLPETPAAVSGNVALTRSSSLGWSLNNCTQLFLPVLPVGVLMTAATKGELSAGNNNYGGFFTSNLRASLMNYLSPVHEFTGISWNKLIIDAQTQTIKKANNTLCNMPDGTKARCVQHPVFKIQ